MKKLKIKLKGFLVVKIAKLRNEIKAYKKTIEDGILKEQQYIDKMNIMKDDIRQLLLKLSKEDREEWLKKKGEQYERHNSKKKRIKKKINKIKNN